MDETVMSDLNSCVTMEIENNSVEGGGESSFHVLERSDGSVTGGYVRRDCGDHVEVTPIGVLCNIDNFVSCQGPRNLVKQLMPKPKDEKTLRLSLPPIVLKFPKELPADINESQKVLDQALDEIKPKLLRSLVEAYNKAVEGTGGERITVEMVEHRLLEMVEHRLRLRTDEKN